MRLGWLMLFSSATLTCLAALVGIYFRMFSKKRFKNHLGNVFLGFAVLMFGMSVMGDAVAPLKDSEQFIRIITEFSNPFWVFLRVLSLRAFCKALLLR